MRFDIYEVSITRALDLHDHCTRALLVCHHIVAVTGVVLFKPFIFRVIQYKHM